MRKVLQSEVAGGLLLMAAAIAALILDNSPLGFLYDRLLELPFGIRLAGFGLEKPLLLWINDGLMAVFFLLVGLEIKREIVEGRLSSRAQAVLPFAAAVGGMAVPALVFTVLNLRTPENLSGWAIPLATDIAFALGVLALLGPRVPPALKVFLTAVAIVDDLGAIAVITLFYTASLSWLALLLAGVCAAGLLLLNRSDVTRFAPYLLVGTAMWVCVLESGVHATLAGVVLALAIPLRTKDASAPSPLRVLEHALHPWVTFLIMPVFAFANSGVALSGASGDSLLHPLTLGIGLGLFAGKQSGVLLASWLAVRLRLASLPAGVSWGQVYAIALLCGIGFTMSLFIGTLAFEGAQQAASVRIGVLAGSLLSGLAGYGVFRAVTPGRARGAEP